MPREREPNTFKPIGPLYTVRGTQTPDQNTGGRSEHEEDRQLDDPGWYKLLPREAYKPPRRQGEAGGPNTIEFSVRGGRGIRLSDTLEGGWGGLEDRDDRLSFGVNRLTITLRLHVSKTRSDLPRSTTTTDFFPLVSRVPTLAIEGKLGLPPCLQFSSYALGFRRWTTPQGDDPSLEPSWRARWLEA